MRRLKSVSTVPAEPMITSSLPACRGSSPAGLGATGLAPAGFAPASPPVSLVRAKWTSPPRTSATGLWDTTIHTADSRGRFGRSGRSR